MSDDPADDGAGAGPLSRGAAHDRATGARCRSSRGVWAIFGHGNVAGVGEALYRHRAELPTYRAHNEQAMAHAAIAFAKAHFRRRMMACTTSIGPGATNLITAAATAHVNRLPVLFLPGDVFVSRAPDPVLQQVEDFHDGGVSANDCFKPVSRYFDRIVAPSQLLTALPRAIAVLTDPAQCGPVTLALPQDVQAEAYDYPEAFFAPTLVRIRAPLPDAAELDAAAAAAARGEAAADRRRRRRPLQRRRRRRAAPVRRGASACRSPRRRRARARCRGTIRCRPAPIGVTGGTAANALARDADLVLAVGTRLSDFTTGSHSLFPQARLVAINVNAFDALKWRATAGASAMPRATLDALSARARRLDGGRRVAGEGDARGAMRGATTVSAIVGVREVAPPALPYDGEVIGAVQRTHPQSAAHDIVVCAAGTLPGELHKLWRAARPGGYHVEYGYSCMGYEIAGGIGVKMAQPEREVVVMVGDGSYLMLNSEIATSVMLGTKLVIVVLDNRGYGCIHRLQQAVRRRGLQQPVRRLRAGRARRAGDRLRGARALARRAGRARRARSRELEAALARARAADRTYVVVIDTDPLRTTEAGGWWWEVGVPEVSESDKVRAARAEYEHGKRCSGNDGAA